MRQSNTNAPTWANLFGETTYHEVSEGRSVLSPAAYFMDLMRVIQNYITVDTSNGGIPFATRRPDLAALILDDLNTFTEVPKLQIVNQVLQGVFANDPELSTHIFPFNLPYDHQLERIRAYLAKNKTSWSAIQKELNDDSVLTSVSMALETLGLSYNQWQIINTALTASADAGTLATYFGYPSTSTDWISQLGTVDNLLQQTGLTMKQLQSLISQDLSKAEISVGLQGDFFINDDDKSSPLFIEQVDPLNIVVSSQGYDESAEYIFGIAYVKTGNDVVIDYQYKTQDPTSVRGMHVVQINPVGGGVIEHKQFDTWASADNAIALAKYVTSIPKGTIVAMATIDDASRFITGINAGEQANKEAISAIENLGSTKISALAYHDSWAFIGVQGGSAMAESLDSGGTEVTATYSAPAHNNLSGLNQIRADKLNRFVRLGKAIGWSFADLDWAIRTSNPSTPVMDMTVLPYLAWMQTLKEQFGLSINQACAMIGIIKDYGAASGQTFFDSIFSNTNIPNAPTWQTNGNYNLTWTFSQLTTSGTSNKTHQITTSLTSALSTALKLSQRDLIFLGNQLTDSGSIALTQQNLGILYRLSLLPKLTGLSMQQVFIAASLLPDLASLENQETTSNASDLSTINSRSGTKASSDPETTDKSIEVVKALISSDPSQVIEAIGSIIEFSKWLKKSGFSLYDLEFAITGHSSSVEVQNRMVGGVAAANFTGSFIRELEKYLLTENLFALKIQSSLTTLLATLKPDLQSTRSASTNGSTSSGSTSDSTVSTSTSNNDADTKIKSTDERTSNMASTATLTATSATKTTDATSGVSNLNISTLVEIVSSAVYGQLLALQDDSTAYLCSSNDQGEIVEGVPTPTQIIDFFKSVPKQAITDLNLSTSQADQLKGIWKGLCEASQSSDAVVAAAYSTFSSDISLCLQNHQLKQRKTLASNLASLLNVSPDIAETIVGWGDQNVMTLLNEVDKGLSATSAIGGLIQASATSQLHILLKLQQCAQTMNLLGLSVAEAAYFKDEIHNYPITLENIQLIWQFKSIVNVFGDTQNNLLSFVQGNVDFSSTITTVNPTSSTAPSSNSGTQQTTPAGTSTDAEPTAFATLTSISGWDLTAVTSLVSLLNISSSGDISGLYLMYRYMTYATLLDVDVSTVIQLASGLPLETPTITASSSVSGTADTPVPIDTERLMANQLWTGLVKKFGNETLFPLSLKLEEHLRDHLVPAVMNHFDVTSVNELYEYLLIDVEVSGVVMTSMVKEAISAAQLYIYRCLHQQEARVSVEPALSVVWTWMRAYREWQANREVLLYPENYIEPDLRKNKTQLFAKLQNDLKQIDLTDDTKVEVVFREYMNGFATEGQLEVVSSATRDYLNGNLQVKELCMIGATKTSPTEYYFRIAEFIYSETTSDYQPETWGEWQKVNLKIDAVGAVTCLYAFGTWYIFWVIQKQCGSTNGGTSSSPNFLSDYKSEIYYSLLNVNGTWGAGQGMGVTSANLSEVYPVYFSSVQALLVSGGADSIVNVSPTTADTSVRGLHVLQIDQRTGKAVAYKHFDTYVSSTNVTELVTFLNGIPNGDIVAIGSVDDGAKWITGIGGAGGSASQEAIAAIQNLGSTAITKFSFRDSWAFIGQQGGKALAENMASGGTQVTASVTLPLIGVLRVVSDGCGSEGFGTIQISREYLYSIFQNSINTSACGFIKYGSLNVPDYFPSEANTQITSSSPIDLVNYVALQNYEGPANFSSGTVCSWFMVPEDDSVLFLYEGESWPISIGPKTGIVVNETQIFKNQTINAHTWYFIAVSNNTLYFNAQTDPDCPTITEVSLSRKFQGYIQETVYFSGMLSPGEIQNIYDNGLSCLTPNFSHALSLSDAFSQSASLRSVTNMPTWNILSGLGGEYLIIPVSGSAAQSFRLNTSAVNNIIPVLNQPMGIVQLFSKTSQQMGENSFVALLTSVGKITFENQPLNQIDFSLNSAMSNYYWELFFHAPFLIAKELYIHQQFKQAQIWYNYIFNPASQDTINSYYPLDKYWQFLGLKASDNTTLAGELSAGFSQELIDDLNNVGIINIFETDPFDPQALADLRPVAYQRAVFIHYVNNLIGWGDQLFRENTRESIVEAEMLYVVAQDLLGRRPSNLGELTLPDGAPFSQISTLNFRGAIVANELSGTESLPPIISVLHADTMTYLGTKGGLFFSTDSGNTWLSVAALHGIAINCIYSDSSGIYLGTSKGLWQSSGSSTWSQIPSCPISDVMQFANFNGSYNVVDSEGNNWYTSNATNLTKSSWIPNKVRYSCIYFTRSVGYIGHLDSVDPGTSGFWFLQVGKDWVQVAGTSLTSISTLAPSADGQTMYFAGVDSTGNGFIMSCDLSTGTRTSLQWNTGQVMTMYHNGQYLFIATQDQELIVLNDTGSTLEVVSSFSITERSTVITDPKGMYLIASDNDFQTISGQSERPYFGIPGNTQILTNWDTLKQRLHDIRNGLNINGQVDALPLFQPAINPEQLVAALSSGEGLDQAMAELDAEIPYYRFPVMLGKAKELVRTVIQLGQSLLSALEKKDAQRLADLHQLNELNILQLTKASKQDELKAAEKTVEMLQISKASTQMRLQHYQKLISNGYLPAEQVQLALQGDAAISQAIGQDIKLTAVEAYLLPNIFGFSDGGMQWGEAVNQAAQIADGMGNLFMTGSQLAGTIAGYQRRGEDWQLQLDLAQDDLKQIELQILAAQYRQRTAENEISVLDKHVQQEQKIANFFKTRFTNEQLYQWYVGKLSGLYFQAYELAYEVAIQAQNSWSFEQLGRAGSAQTFIKSGYWNSLHQGLLAGETLEIDLLRMEKTFTDQNQRRLEIEKTISLAQLDSAALTALKTSGSCVFDLTEKDFDRDFLGHFCRQIKSLSLSIPMVVGPYQNIHATLTQISSKIIISDDGSGQSAVSSLIGGTSNSNTSSSNNTALMIDLRPNQQVALSDGMNDSGLFTLNFNDERYLPFEGTGAVSSWQLDMPLDENQIDFSTISDVILKLRYTALQGSSSFKTFVKGQLAGNQNS
ncbi:interleukin-like EMT inducer domain-containing protein [Marinoscillum sp.]|uniref:Tc toxin subunit A-related protein n=1 Tax=Marinoscillum sp. TaxID=2024838 RepID=UPI003BAA3070